MRNTKFRGGSRRKGLKTGSIGHVGHILFLKLLFPFLKKLVCMFEIFRKFKKSQVTNFYLYSQPFSFAMEEADLPTEG